MSEKTKYTLEYSVNTSVRILYDRISTPEGLSEWFADDVHIRGNFFTFIWDGQEQVAELVNKKDLKLARFKWVDSNDDSYFEFRINVDELTGDVALIVTDFIEEEEKEDSISLWDTQISEMKRTIGI